ncbi:hypothetical protein ADN00_02545 [Ornatilinea apprima]|uniref:Glucosyl-3-phosphoglycerate synthase n=1 Tax=Ornatilinea apprima TaxID=1134406 RepID=A0A0N8GP08_9CHLR|nr:glycosyltransferase family 2 protein [Ornatilinea apprima]KPL79578.1 hypothetical protein ADN00_02545 [Ornatilinea apprima]
MEITTLSSDVRPTCAAIVCAYNEEKTLANLLDNLLASPYLDEIIVVNDGSTDQTAAILDHYAWKTEIQAVHLPGNHGKGYALAEGISRARSEALLFIDADLQNWHCGYELDLLRPLLQDQADMVIGYPIEGSDLFEPVDPLGLLHWISGERAVWRRDALPLVELIRDSRFGVETHINLHYRQSRQRVQFVRLNNLKHPIKLQKSSLLPALRGYAQEGAEILQTCGYWTRKMVRGWVENW